MEVPLHSRGQVIVLLIVHMVGKELLCRILKFGLQFHIIEPNIHKEISTTVEINRDKYIYAEAFFIKNHMPLYLCYIKRFNPWSYTHLYCPNVLTPFPQVYVSFID